MTSRASFALIAALTGSALACSDAGTPTSPTSTDPATFTFASSFATNGSASRSFEQLTTGAVTLTLSAASPAVRLGVGLGMPRPDGIGCNLTRAIETEAGSAPHITATAEPGVWCVRVWDPGLVAEQVSFTLGVTHY